VVETLKIINQMQADGIIGKYAIGGAIGASFYLEPTSSLDIDIFISFDGIGGSRLAPLQGIYNYLTPLGAQPQGEHLVLEGWLIQFLPVEDDLHKEALAEAVSTEVRGVKTWVMTAEHLIAIALKLGRKKDDARVERFVEIGEFDPNYLDDVLRRYNLLGKWKAISDKYTGSSK
jgi:hypothetical protein